MRLIDADELMANITELRCRNCDRRKNSHGRIVYEIGDAPCRACGIYDAIEWICAAGEFDAVPVVRCKDCKWYGTYQLTKYGECDKRYKPSVCIKGEYSIMRNEDWFCADGERKFLYTDEICRILNSLPSAQSERKTGKWVKENVVLTSNPPQYIWHCSECGGTRHGYSAEILTDFCPNCGAKMETEQ